MNQAASARLVPGQRPCPRKPVQKPRGHPQGAPGPCSRQRGEHMEPIPTDEQIIEILKVDSPATVPSIRDRLDRPKPVEVIRQHCVRLAEKGRIRSLGQDVYASNGTTIEDMILSILRR